MQGHLIAKTFESLDEPSRGVFRLQPVKKVGPDFAIGFLALDHLVRHHEHRMGEGQNGTLLPTPRGEPAVWRTQIGAFGPRRDVSRLHLLGLVEQRGLAMGLTAMGIQTIARLKRA